MNRIQKVSQEFKILFNSVPGYIVAFFAVSVVLMNLLANKSIDGLPEWLALDCGFFLSWMGFLCMDVLTKRFGARASIMLSVFALGVNLLVAIILFGVSLVPGTWAASFDFMGDVDGALNATVGGTWFVLMGSSIAFLTSAVVNALMNQGIGKLTKKNPDGFAAFALRSYVSTAFAQFVDNLVFAFIVSHFFFGWTVIQCIMCAATGAVFELLAEVAFSPWGYKITKSWKESNIGAEYIEKYVAD